MAAIAEGPEGARARSARGAFSAGWCRQRKFLSLVFNQVKGVGLYSNDGSKPGSKSGRNRKKFQVGRACKTKGDQRRVELFP
ncbi:Hypothetical predicted protein [Podarcis lilfordi]|uniref:Uncharacterized protein n=1 Tax=Podarcis lilfordi TaxID=74358 RepID=A0AA35LIX5_9SAUR|nr:Hypothetical predicted protein [Podarcis lilfordi]